MISPAQVNSRVRQFEIKNPGSNRVRNCAPLHSAGGAVGNRTQHPSSCSTPDLINHTTVSQYDHPEELLPLLFQYPGDRNVALIGGTLRGNARETLR